MTISAESDQNAPDITSKYYNRPLIPASILSNTVFPTVTIPDKRYRPLCETGAQRAMDSFGTIENHERGILGEYAYGKLFGVANQVDTEIYEFGDPGYDFKLGGVTIDVKTARPRWDDPSLMVDASKELTADFYVLVHQLSQRCYRILGYAPAAVVAAAPIRRIRPHSAEKVRVIEQSWLYPFTGTSANELKNSLHRD